MPEYLYRCQKCSEEITIRHSISEKPLKAPNCDEDCKLDKIPVLSFRKPKTGITKAGDLVKKHIAETREDIEQERRTMKKEYEP